MQAVFVISVKSCLSPLSFLFLCYVMMNLLHVYIPLFPSILGYGNGKVEIMLLSLNMASEPSFIYYSIICNPILLG